MSILLQKPNTWRTGQTLFNFLEWLKVEKGVDGNQNERLADTFHIPENEIEKYYNEFIKKHLYLNNSEALVLG